MPITIGLGPEITFTNPLGWLRGCHDRIAHFLKVLVTVATRRQWGALHRADRETLEAFLRYFREAAPKHTEDEEQSLFPRLKESTAPSAVALRPTLHALAAEHQTIQKIQSEAEQLVERWLMEGQLLPHEGKRLLALLPPLQGSYEKHMEVEDREVFSVAARVLTASQMVAIGREMAKRRGIDPDLAIAYPMEGPPAD